MVTHTLADYNMQAFANLVRSRRSQQLEHQSTSESASISGETERWFRLHKIDPEFIEPEASGDFCEALSNERLLDNGSRATAIGRPSAGLVDPLHSSQKLVQSRNVHIAPWNEHRKKLARRCV